MLKVSCFTSLKKEKKTQAERYFLQNSIRYRAAEAGVYILADYLTLFQPGVRLCPPHYYLPSGFSDLPPALLGKGERLFLVEVSRRHHQDM